MSNSIKIKEMVTKKEILSFIRFPKILYRDCPYFVPSLESGDYETLTAHPARAFCDLKLWMAFIDDKPVGRIAGIINRRYNELRESKRFRFGWFDVIDDIEVTKALMNKVIDWGKQHFLTELTGPSRFSNMEKQGLIVEGFDVSPSFSTDYNFPYYKEHLEKLGFNKEVDYIQSKIKVNPVPEKIERMYNLIMKKYDGIKIKKFSSQKEMNGYAKDFFLALNDSFHDIYNFIPLTEAEIEYLVKTNFVFAQKDIVSLITDEKDKIIGFAFCIPSLSRALQKSKGKLFPFGWFHLMKALRGKNDTVNLLLTGTVSEWQQKGIHVVYHKLLNDAFIKRGFKYGISNPQLDSITAPRIWDKYEAEQYCRKRCYVKNI